MSATARGAVRHPDDFYATPGWAVRAILPHLLPQMPERHKILEPAAGQGAIVRELFAAGVDPHRLVAVEVDIQRAAAFSKTFGPNGGINCFDFRHYAFSCRRDGLDFDLVITNPPFALAMEFVEESLSITKPGGSVAMLLRLPWLASQKRAPWLRRHTPSVYVLPKRPSFYEGAPPTPQPTLFGDDAAEDAKGSGTDATDYAWMVWSKTDDHGVERVPTVKILEIEPLVDRRVA